MTYTRRSLLDDSKAAQQSSWSQGLPSDGAFDVAGVGGWIARREMQRNPSLEGVFRKGVQRFIGGGYSDRELKTLEDRALDALEVKDFEIFHGLQGADQIVLTPAQKARLDALVGKLGDDDLGRRARKSYEDSVRAGKLKVQ